MFGQLFYFVTLISLEFVGANGFVGVKIEKQNGFDALYLGFALLVKIDEEPP